jgi:hypothetical protein
MDTRRRSPIAEGDPAQDRSVASPSTAKLDRNLPTLRSAGQRGARQSIASTRGPADRELDRSLAVSLPGDEDWRRRENARLRAQHTCIREMSSMRCRACNAGVPFPHQSIGELLDDLAARR